MKKAPSEIIKFLKDQYKSKSSYFWQLAVLLEVSIIMIDDLEMLNEIPFPPSEDFLKLYHQNMYSVNSSEDISADFPSEDLTNQSNNEMIVKLIDDGINRLRNLQFEDDISLSIAMDCCLNMHFIYRWIASNNSFTNYELLNRIDSLQVLAISRAYQLIGYWTVKIKEKLRNKRGGATEKVRLYEERIKKLSDSLLKCSTSQDNDLIVEKAEFDRLCKEVLDVKADVSYPTKKKYHKNLEELIGKKIVLR